MISTRIDKTIDRIELKILLQDILDIGCSGINHKGTMANRLKKLAKSYKGIDYKENVEKFSLNKKYSVITCFETLEHVDNVGLALKNIKRHLKEDGTFICTVPNIRSIFCNLIPQSDYHLSCWDEKVLWQLLMKYFKIVNIEKINFNRQLLAICIK